jgi:hypothetical protein
MIKLRWKIKSLGRPRSTWENNRMDLKELRCGDMDWIHLVHDRGVGSGEHQNKIKGA